jgi:hypothetical protein
MRCVQNDRPSNTQSNLAELHIMLHVYHSLHGPRIGPPKLPKRELQDAWPQQSPKAPDDWLIKLELCRPAPLSPPTESEPCGSSMQTLAWLAVAGMLHSLINPAQATQSALTFHGQSCTVTQVELMPAPPVCSCPQARPCAPSARCT